MNKKKLYKITKRAIENTEKYLWKEALWDEVDIHAIILNRFRLTEDDYQKIMNWEKEGASDE